MADGTCLHCGANNKYTDRVCRNCRLELPWSDAIQSVMRVEDQPSTLLNVFSLIFPVVGLAAWLILMGSSPRRSKEAGISALVSVVLMPVTVFILAALMRP